MKDSVTSSAPRTQRRGFRLRQLLALLEPHWIIFSIGTIFMIGGVVANLLIPALLRVLLNDYDSHWIALHWKAVALLVVALFAFQSICFYLRSLLFGVLGQRVAARLRGDLYRAIIEQPIKFFDTQRAADLSSRITNDASVMQDAVSIRLSVLIRYTLQVIVGVAMMSFISPYLTGIVVCILVILVAISFGLGRSLRALSRRQQTEVGRISTIANETFTAARVVKAFDREQHERSRFTEVNDRVLDLGVRRSRVSAFFQASVSFLLNSAIALLVLDGVLLVVRSEMPAGDLTAFLTYGVIVAVSFSFIAGSFSELAQALGAAERVFDLMEQREPTVQSGSEKLSGLTPLEFKAVSFAYPSRPGLAVLSDVSFTVARGETVAIVGPSGAGKSTIINLILRFYDPISGTISFDGKAAERLPAADIRRRIAFVPQDPELFGVSLADNIRYGKEDATNAELAVACARANIKEFIDTLEDGLETVLGDRGVQLSGGQKQRIAIARALLRDPELLILDEATSALDSENEALVRAALAELLRGRSSIVIAHRLSTVRSADKVIVLDQGKIVQVGRHEELARVPGLYRQLVERQELPERGSRDESFTPPVDGV